MIRSQATIADARELQTQLCAYNSAFEELDLMFRWDVDTLQSILIARTCSRRIARSFSARPSSTRRTRITRRAVRRTLPGPTIRTAPGCGAPLAPNRTQNPRELPTR
jgi:hypothetical protein